MIKRRSLLKAVFLGAAVAFTQPRLAVAKPKDEGPTYDDLVKIGRMMDAAAIPDDAELWFIAEHPTEGA